MSVERVDTIRERLAHAAPAPWKWEPDIGERDFHGFPMRCTIRTPEWARYGYEPEDACFIAHAPDDIAYLLDALAQVEAERDALRAEVERLSAALLHTPYLVAGVIGCARCSEAWPCADIRNHRIRAASSAPEGGERP